MKKYSFLAAGNLNIACLGETRQAGECSHYSHLLHKFQDDCFFRTEDGTVSFLNGYVYNKTDYEQAYGLNWAESLTRALTEDAGGALK